MIFTHLIASLSFRTDGCVLKWYKGPNDSGLTTSKIGMVLRFLSLLESPR